VFHALTGDAHAAGYNTATDQRPGWWDIMVGPGKAFDTNRYCVICANVIGGCKGSTGPGSIDPETGAPYGLSFPIVTLSDMVRAQERLITHLGIQRLLAVVGGSMGGMMALDWSVRYPDRVAAVLAIASTARLTAQGIAFNEVGRQAIMADPEWRQGAYYEERSPEAGLAVARMIAHITYLSNVQMHRKFGRRLQDREALGYDFSTEFQVESYLRYQGNAFVRRFDANTYLYITKAIDYFDLANGSGSLVEALEGVRAEFLVVSFSSDWLFPTEQSRELVRALQANGVPTTFMEIESDYGHDAFFLPNAELNTAVSGFLANAYGRVQACGGGA
jgi:homoserine O-acetyltransferase